MTRARIAVLGGDGFVGRAMVRALAASDWAEPVIVGRRSIAPTAGGTERIQADATDAGALASALTTIDGVINCVLGKGDTMPNNARALFGIAKIRPTLRVVHLSSMAVYGPALGAVDETAPLVADDWYSTAKVEAERIAADCANVAILRPGIVYGPGGPQWSARIAEWLMSHRVGDLGAAGDGYCNLVHVDDVAQAALRALREPAAGGQAYNLSMPDPPTWNEYFLRYAKLLGAVPISRITARRLLIETKLFGPPLKVVELVARKAKLSTHWLPQPIPSSLLVLWGHEIRLSTRKSTEELGVRYTPLDEGLSQTARAFLATVKRRA